jgi:predicted nucleic acid-binding protein
MTPHLHLVETAAVVVDASTLVHAFTVEKPGGTIRTRLSTPPCICAPDLIDAEFVNALRSLVTRGQLDERDAELALGDFATLPLERESTELLVRRMWQLRHNLTAYDAAYVVLAETLGVPLLTLDRRLSKIAGLRCTVEVPRVRAAPRQ